MRGSYEYDPDVLRARYSPEQQRADARQQEADLNRAMTISAIKTVEGMLRGNCEDYVNNVADWRRTASACCAILSTLVAAMERGQPL